MQSMLVRRVATTLGLLVSAAFGCAADDPVVIEDPLPTEAEAIDTGAERPQQGAVDGGAPDPVTAEAGAGPPDASPADAAPPPKVCPPVSEPDLSGARWAIATRSTQRKTLDGDLSDWNGCASIVLDAATAARVKGTPDAEARIYVEWDPSALWVAVDVRDRDAAADAGADHVGDSVEVFASGSGYRTGDYGPYDVRYAFERDGTAVKVRRYWGAFPYEMAHVAAVPGGYRVEMRIDAVAELGARLAAGDVRFFDVILNDGRRQAAFLIWAMQPHATCSCERCECNRSPASDTLLFAPLTLE